MILALHRDLCTTVQTAVLRAETGDEYLISASPLHPTDSNDKGALIVERGTQEPFQKAQYCRSLKIANVIPHQAG